MKREMWQVEKKYEKVPLLMDRIYYDRFTPSSSRNRGMVDEKKSFLTRRQRSLDADEKSRKMQPQHCGRTSGSRNTRGDSSSFKTKT